MNKYILTAITIVFIMVLIIGVWLYDMYDKESEKIIIFSAGSLKIPLDQLSRVYEEKYGIKVHLETSGSIQAIRKVIDLGKEADIIAVADYRLITRFLVPNYTKWYIAFASNEVVLTYTSKSKYHDILEKDPNKWYEIFSKPDVRWGFSDPNKDPCGYRSVGIIVLAGIYYNNPEIPEKLLYRRTNIYYKERNNTIHIYVPSTLSIKDNNLVIRAKSTDLISLLEAGSIDYAFEYRSVAIQHGLKYIELPRQINLGDPKYDDFYSKVIVHILVGTDKEMPIPMKSIVYGITILDKAPHYQNAVKFIKLLLSDTGRNIFEKNGQRFLEEPLMYGSIPEEIKK
ncbi:MAG: tungstate ABC transporter substrate-binding protein WtpA [Thermoprotei archaeon]|nr:MAG: tungstate ABC transporter substrate-binding protein WtpA [Thermoprotei archaeon]